MQAIWKGAISFGMVTIPIKVFSATEEKDISFRQVHVADGGRIRYKRVCSECGEEVPYSDIGKGYEMADGRMVVLEPDDFADLPLSSKKVIDVLEFVPADHRGGVAGIQVDGGHAGPRDHHVQVQPGVADLHRAVGRRDRTDLARHHYPAPGRGRVRRQQADRGPGGLGHRGVLEFLVVAIRVPLAQRRGAGIPDEQRRSELARVVGIVESAQRGRDVNPHEPAFLVVRGFRRPRVARLRLPLVVSTSSSSASVTHCAKTARSGIAVRSAFSPNDTLPSYDVTPTDRPCPGINGTTGYDASMGAPAA